MVRLKKKHIIWSHIIYWFIKLFIDFSFLFFYTTEVPLQSYLQTLFNNILYAISFYIAYSLIIPIFSKHGKLSWKVVKMISISVTTIILVSFLLKLFIELYMERNPLSYYRYLINALSITTSFIFLGGFFRLAINGLNAILKKTKLEEQNLKSELALLRSQINPHFLFNTLNNIHSFTQQEPDKAAFSIIKLSDIMRYMLNESNSDRVLLEDEINYIKSYIALQNVRYSDKDFIKIEISGNADGLLIAPMIFVPFVENAFKHSDKRKKNGIEIHLDINKPVIDFEVKNFKRKLTTLNDDEKSGFGLENVKRRLALAYPDKHELKISEDNVEYKVKLKINLENEN